MNATIMDSQPLNDEIVTGIVMKQLKGRILNCNTLLFTYHAPSGLWKQDDSSALMIQETIDDWSVDRKLFRGFNVKTLRDHIIDLGETPDMSRVAAKALIKIARDDYFLIDIHASTHRKIKFLDCFYDILHR